MKKISITFSLFIFTSGLAFGQNANTFNDLRDNKIYQTVKIGNQTWFAENLAFKPLNGKYWAYDNNNSNVAHSGYLYDWNTANNSCPNGWHLPSLDDWNTLIKYLGGIENAGSKLRAKSGWKSHDGIISTNQYGFNALPTGYLVAEDKLVFYEQHGFTCFWTSSEGNEKEDAWFVQMAGHENSITGNTDKKKNYGYSVRCVRN